MDTEEAAPEDSPRISDEGEKEGLKGCPRCRFEWPTVAFPRDKTRTDGRSQYCRNCTAIKNTPYFNEVYYPKHREKIITSVQEKRGKKSVEADLLDITAAAKFADVGIPTLRRDIWLKLVPTILVKGRVFIYRTDLNVYKAKRKKGEIGRHRKRGPRTVDRVVDARKDGTPMPDQMTPNEAATYLELSIAGIGQAVRRNLLPFSESPDGRKTFRLADLDAYRENHRRRGKE